MRKAHLPWLSILVISQFFCGEIYISHTEFWVNLTMWCIQWVLWPFYKDYQRACIVHVMGWNQSPSICLIFRQKAASILLYIAYKASTPLISQNYIDWKTSKIPQNMLSQVLYEKKLTSEESSQKGEHSHLFTVDRSFCEVSQNMLLQVLYEK